MDVTLPAGDAALEASLARPAGPARGALVLLHGFASGRAEYADAPERLAARGWTALAIDSRAHGRRATLEGTVRADLVVEDLAAAVRFLREKEGARGPLGLVAHSMGGALACFALPRLLDFGAAALVAPLDTVRAELGALEWAGYRAALAASRAAVRLGLPPIVVSAPTRYEDLFLDAEAARRATAAPFLSDRVSLAGADALLAMTGAAWAREVRTPTLVLLAQQDKRVKRASSLRVYEALAGPKRLAELDCGHSVWGDCRADDVAAALDGWFAETLAPPSG